MLPKLARTGLLAAALLLLTSGALAQDFTLPNGVAAGDVIQTSAVLWTRSTAPGTVTFELAADEDFAAISLSLTAEAVDPTLPVKVNVEGLTPGTRYFYRVTDAAASVAVGRFRTPAAPGVSAGLRFGVSGDWRGELAPYPSIGNAAGRALDFFVLHGDTVYADFPSPALQAQAQTLAEFRLKHAEVYGERYGLNTWADVRASTAVLATIDDHEVTNDFAGGAAPATDARFDESSAAFINDTAMYENGLQAFQEYNPLRDEFYDETGDPRTAGERRLYRYVTYGSDAAVFVIDARSFRDDSIPNLDEFTAETVGGWLAQSFEPGRTMLGAVQLADLKADLLQAQADGIRWKFILVPEPAQNFGVVNGGDRFEGYAAERADLMQFIVDNSIQNVVFIAADIHGTIVNNVGYQTEPGGAWIPTGAFEVTTGPVAFAAPLGPGLIELAHQLGFLTDGQKGLYDQSPPLLKDLFVTRLIDAQVEPLGYDPVGLDGSDIAAEQVTGGYTVTHSFGWTEFEIEAGTGALRIVTYGIPFYSRAELEADPAGVTAREPEVMSEFVVTPR